MCIACRMRVGCARRVWGGLKKSFDGLIKVEAFNQDVGGGMICCMFGLSPSSVTKYTRTSLLSSVSRCASLCCPFQL